MTMSEQLKQFLAVFDTLVADVMDVAVNQYETPKESQQWMSENLKYNVPGGKMNRGLSVVSTYEILLGRPLTKDELFKAQVLGWSVEWLQAFFLVADDMMDQSQTRRGQPCWYKKPEVSNIAINDSFVIEGSIYILLKKYFRSEPYYVDLLDLLHEVTFQTELGQMLDLITAPEDHVDLTRFTLSKYKTIVKYKTAVYSFYLPVAMAMHMAGVKNPAAFAAAHSILMEMGEFFQIQDDYLDCYGDPAVIGKIGTDIQDNKCSWLVIQALDLANADQRKILEQHYARKDEASVAAVKALYKELELQRVFTEYEEKSFAKLTQLINELDTATIPREVFTEFAKKIYKRQK
ncbi:geranyltranstransferase [Capsaspora owczarzaki ATCC 30864]|uniref:Geranyltranstransferase n=1 Tax=Capsaspora owczarzaki (strain ATCC 30864) TaxID=595528 RepID=A0A0D2X444_CAPO3|nr:geranyltranstransferase [Capsaspora owczarzaki ATCC 30864]KJE95414.1 geranyltranstransferase [Capsaspora owczarzaki ATCC 30864]|eukprot:XP_004345458.2 geranyltranstransferase [Capsaspora owczarzaki ATCC 30864]